MVQLDYDEEMGPLHGMYGTMEAESEILRTIRLAELTAFLCLLRKVSGPTNVLVGVCQAKSWRLQTCGSRFGKNYMSWLKEASQWKWHM